MANIMVRNFTLRPETAVDKKTKEGPWFKNRSGLSRFPGDVPLYTIHKGDSRRKRPGTAQPTRSKPRQYGGQHNPTPTVPKTPADIKNLEDENKKLKEQLHKLQKKGDRRSRLSQLLMAEEARAEEAKAEMNEPYQLKQRQFQLQAEIEELESMQVTSPPLAGSRRRCVGMPSRVTLTPHALPVSRSARGVIGVCKNENANHKAGLCDGRRRGEIPRGGPDLPHGSPCHVEAFPRHGSREQKQISYRRQLTACHRHERPGRHAAMEEAAGDGNHQAASDRGPAGQNTGPEDLHFDDSARAHHEWGHTWHGALDCSCYCGLSRAPKAV